MKRKETPSYSVCLALAFSVVHCGIQGPLDDPMAGTDFGNPGSNQVALQIVGIESGASAALTALGSGLVLEEARITLGEIEFASKSSCNDDAQTGDASKIDFKGPFVADLLTDTSVPDIGQAMVPAGIYCEIEVKLDKLEGDEIPVGIADDDLMVGNSMVVRGTTPSGTPFQLLGAFDQEFELESETGIPVAGNGFEQLFIAFVLDAFFDGVNFDTAEATNGTILIDGMNNTSHLEAIKKNVQRAARLFGDEDDDGELDDDEREDDDVLGEGKEGD